MRILLIPILFSAFHHVVLGGHNVSFEVGASGTVKEHSDTQRLRALEDEVKKLKEELEGCRMKCECGQQAVGKSPKSSMIRRVVADTTPEPELGGEPRTKEVMDSVANIYEHDGSALEGEAYQQNAAMDSDPNSAEEGLIETETHDGSIMETESYQAGGWLDGENVSFNHNDFCIKHKDGKYLGRDGGNLVLKGHCSHWEKWSLETRRFTQPHMRRRGHIFHRYLKNNGLGGYLGSTSSGGIHWGGGASHYEQLSIYIPGWLVGPGSDWGLKIENNYWQPGKALSPWSHDRVGWHSQGSAGGFMWQFVGYSHDKEECQQWHAKIGGRGANANFIPSHNIR